MAEHWLSLLVLSTLAAASACRSVSSSHERAAPDVSALPANAIPKRGSDSSAARENTDRAIALMMAFAERTGLSSDRPQRRYLWTDAFAVCNFLGFARQTGRARYRELALGLVDRVHHTLGKHRADDTRRGWISGLSETDGEAHPTRGGLRIGKELPERKPGERFDAELEWDRDGQYFHYLTQWMHALDQVARVTKQPVYNTWARELAIAAQRGFVVHSGGRPRMVWKMSIDLSRPLVPSMGQHDPLDGFVTCAELEATRAGFGEKSRGPRLTAAIADFESMLEDGSLTTTDPLGLGALLADAHRIEQLAHDPLFRDDRLRDRLLAAALSGLQTGAPLGELDAPAEQRLAFRELGLAIGLEALGRIRSQSADLAKLARYRRFAEKIIAFWLEPAHQRAASWLEHRDINEVMLATALAPDGYLALE